MAFGFQPNSNSAPINGSSQNTTTSGFGSNSQGLFGGGLINNTNNNNTGFGSNNNVGGFGSTPSTNTSNNPFGGLRSCSNVDNNQAPSLSSGTAHVAFHPYIEKPAYGAHEVYQSINMMHPYHKQSFEELRLADYDGGRRVGEANVPQPSVGLFGTAKASLFGSNLTPANGGSNNGGGLFGNPSNNSVTGGDLFGNPSNSTDTSGGLFGQPDNQVVSPFGCATNNNNNSKMLNSGFGQHNSTGGGLFGSSTNTAGTSGGLFGQPQNNRSGLFSNLPNNNGTSSGLFGNSNNSTATSAGLFGNPRNTNDQRNANTGLFTNTDHSTGSLFGSATPNNGTGLFSSRNNNTRNESVGFANNSCGCAFGSRTTYNNPHLERHQPSNNFGLFGQSRQETGTSCGPFCPKFAEKHDHAPHESFTGYGCANSRDIAGIQSDKIKCSCRLFCSSASSSTLDKKDREIARLQAELAKLSARISLSTFPKESPLTKTPTTQTVSSTNEAVSVMPHGSESKDAAGVEARLPPSRTISPQKSSHSDVKLEEMYKAQTKLMMSVMERLEKLEVRHQNNKTEIEPTESSHSIFEGPKPTEFDRAMAKLESATVIELPKEDETDDEENETALIESGLSTPVNIFTPGTDATGDKSDAQQASGTSEDLATLKDRDLVIGFLKGRKSAGSTTAASVQEIARGLNTSVAAIWEAATADERLGMSRSLNIKTEVNMPAMIELR